MTIQPDGRADNQPDNQPFLPRGLLYIGLAGLLLFGVLYCLGRAFVNPTEKYTFWVLGGANILLFLAILLQALIYARQWHVMDRQWKDGQRAYVGIKDIKVPHPQSSRNPWLIIQNIGKLPADNVGVEIQIIGLIPSSTIEKYTNHALQSVYAPDMFWLDFLRTKLFSEGVCFDIEVPLEELLGSAFLMCVSAGEARLIVQVRLKYWDGFDRDQSDYAFRWDSGWKSWPVWTQDDLPSRIAEEIARYPQHAKTN